MSTVKQDKTKDLLQIETLSDKSPVAYYMLTGAQKSGFIQEGTEMLPDPIEIMYPSYLSLLTSSHYFKKNKDGIPERVPIRYIYGVAEIEVAKQKVAGHEPNRMQDTIVFKNGKLTVAREGNDVGLYDYLKYCSFNTTNPDRNNAIDGRFYEVVPEKEKLGLNDFAFAEAEAIKLIQKLIISRKGDEVKYDETRINTYCQLFSVSGREWSSRINALISIAKKYPQEFVQKIEALDGRIDNEIMQGEELKVIAYGTTSVAYVHKDKIILPFTGASLSLDKKRERLVTFFQSQDGAVAYQEFLVELEDAKKKSLN